MENEDSPFVVVAKIVKTHGIKGEVVLESLTDVEGRLEKTERFVLMEKGKQIQELEVEFRRFFKDRHVLKFVGISTRNESELLRNKELAIPEEQLGELSSGQFFIHKLQGMRVLLKNGEVVGTVRGVMKTAGVDLLEVGENGDILIPFAEDICIEVNEEEGRIVIDPPEGLLQLNAR